MSSNISYLIFVDAEEEQIFILDKETADKILKQVKETVEKLSEGETQSFMRKLNWARRIGESTQGGSP